MPRVHSMHPRHLVWDSSENSSDSVHSKSAASSSYSRIFQQQQEVPSNPTPAAPSAPEVSRAASSTVSAAAPPVSAAPPVAEPGGVSQAPAADGTRLPSRGSAQHHQQACKPCVFFHRNLCEQGDECKYCHFDHKLYFHSLSKKKRVKYQKMLEIHKLTGTRPGLDPDQLARDREDERGEEVIYI
mmetsp:Transcript_67114/g.189040  ORF Transcript_67114/g.189040 Transcript_67114/m.189040 type:complete len:185 (+) Transcript_67114:83-637(+)